MVSRIWRNQGCGDGAVVVATFTRSGSRSQTSSYPTEKKTIKMSYDIIKGHRPQLTSVDRGEVTKSVHITSQHLFMCVYQTKNVEVRMLQALKRYGTQISKKQHFLRMTSQVKGHEVRVEIFRSGYSG